MITTNDLFAFIGACWISLENLCRAHSFSLVKCLFYKQDMNSLLIKMFEWSSQQDTRLLAFNCKKSALFHSNNAWPVCFFFFFCVFHFISLPFENFVCVTLCSLSICSWPPLINSFQHIVSFHSRMNWRRFHFDKNNFNGKFAFWRDGKSTHIKINQMKELIKVQFN